MSPTGSHVVCVVDGAVSVDAGKWTDTSQLVLVDFGIAKDYKPGYPTSILSLVVTASFAPGDTFTTICGSPSYVAPEVTGDSRPAA